MRVLTLLIAVLLLVAGSAMAQEKNLVVNGDFEKVKEGKAENWELGKEGETRISVVEEKGNHFLRIAIDQPMQIVSVRQRIKLDPKWKSLTVKARMRGKRVKLGEKEFHTPRVTIMFVGADGKQVGDWPDAPALSADSDWMEVKETMKVPEGAVEVEIRPTLIQAEGVVDFDDVVVTAR